MYPQENAESNLATGKAVIISFQSISGYVPAERRAILTQLTGNVPEPRCSLLFMLTSVLLIDYRCVSWIGKYL